MGIWGKSNDARVILWSKSNNLDITYPLSYYKRTELETTQLSFFSSAFSSAFVFLSSAFVRSYARYIPQSTSCCLSGPLGLRPSLAKPPIVAPVTHHPGLGDRGEPTLRLRPEASPALLETLVTTLA
jgi:hypothetical protein